MPLPKYSNVKLATNCDWIVSLMLMLSGRMMPLTRMVRSSPSTTRVRKPSTTKLPFGITWMTCTAMLSTRLRLLCKFDVPFSSRSEFPLPVSAPVKLCFRAPAA